MGKYGGLSGQYHYKTRKQADDNLAAARKHDKENEFNMRITGSRGFWTLTIAKKLRSM